MRRDLKAWNIREEWATDRERWKRLCKTHTTPHRETAAKGEIGGKFTIDVHGQLFWYGPSESNIIRCHKQTIEELLLHRS